MGFQTANKATKQTKEKEIEWGVGTERCSNELYCTVLVRVQDTQTVDRTTDPHRRLTFSASTLYELDQHHWFPEQRAEKNGRRTCSALRWRLAFPPDVVLIVLVIEITIVISVAVVVVVRIPVLPLDVVLVPSAAARLLARGRHGGRRVVPCGLQGIAADWCAGRADAVRTKPLAVWDRGEGWAEARVVVRFVALQR